MSLEGINSESQSAPIAGDEMDLQSSPVVPRFQWYLPLKAGVERAIALVLFVLVLPLLALLAALVKFTSPGPAFYSQSRVGRNHRIFLMHKLRTMRHCCEAETGPVWSMPNDNRITRVGRFLRKTHLDELPQLLNVLQGHMCLIGPRPERPEICKQIENTIPRFRERLQIHPGMTGLAQTQLPSDTGMHTVRRKLAYDLYYIREVNPWLDARIALSTLLYLCGVVFHSLGRRMVSPYGMAAENDDEMRDLTDSEESEIPVT
ncbi:MAG TPA: sugar transferase [Tepidisphaeraceae bacterium]|nr:sugar transferase [Tepidisphaeraceae bacterium]